MIILYTYDFKEVWLAGSVAIGQLLAVADHKLVNFLGVFCEKVLDLLR